MDSNEGSEHVHAQKPLGKARPGPCGWGQALNFLMKSSAEETEETVWRGVCPGALCPSCFPLSQLLAALSM